MQDDAVFKISYGLFFLGSEFEGNKNICVVNTVAQITQEPLKISVTVLKTNLTAELIFKSKKFSVGVMDHSANLDDIAHFGQQSGKNVDKLIDMDCSLDVLNNPVFKNGCNASLTGAVTDVVDLGTHYLFIADLKDAAILSDKPSLTYADYRAMRSGTFNKSDADSKTNDTWQCSVCHYVYDGETPFEDLPDDYICPVCKKPKSVFKKV